jgi:hypothetical protein
VCYRTNRTIGPTERHGSSRKTTLTLRPVYSSIETRRDIERKHFPKRKSFAGQVIPYLGILSINSLSTVLGSYQKKFLKQNVFQKEKIHNIQWKILCNIRISEKKFDNNHS